MKVSPAPLYLVFLVRSAAAAVQIHGTTLPPTFQRSSDSLSARCPLSHPFALSGGSKCCPSPLRDLTDSDCASVAADPSSTKLMVADPEECCQGSAGGIADCPAGGGCASLEEKSVCPRSHPFPFAYGAKCCSYNRREENTCPFNDTIYLQSDDPDSCCHHGDSLDCPAVLTSKGSTSLRLALCKPNPRGTVCYQQYSNNLDYTGALSYCQENDLLPIRFRTKQEIKHILGKSGGWSDSWTGVFMAREGGANLTCDHADCDGWLRWEDGSGSVYKYGTTRGLLTSANNYTHHCMVYAKHGCAGQACLQDRGCSENYKVLCQKPCN